MWPPGRASEWTAGAGAGEHLQPSAGPVAAGSGAGLRRRVLRNVQAAARALGVASLGTVTCLSLLLSASEAETEQRQSDLRNRDIFGTDTLGGGMLGTEMVAGLTPVNDRKDALSPAMQKAR